METRRRKRLRRYEIAHQPRFLTFSCYHRLPLLSNDAIKSRFVEHMRTAKARDCFRLIAWVVMPDHVHLIIVPNHAMASMEQVLTRLKGDFAREVIGRWKELDAGILHRITRANGCRRFWQHGGGYDRNIRDENELWEKIEYIHANPVRRGIVPETIDWPWSSARWYAGDRAGSLIEIDSA